MIDFMSIVSFPLWERKLLVQHELLMDNYSVIFLFVVHWKKFIVNQLSLGELLSLGAKEIMSKEKERRQGNSILLRDKTNEADIQTRPTGNNLERLYTVLAWSGLHSAFHQSYRWCWD